MPALESGILNCKTLLHNFTSISTISQNLRTICPVVTEISVWQNFGRKKKEEEEKEEKKKNIKKRAETINLPTLFRRLNLR